MQEPIQTPNPIEPNDPTPPDGGNEPTVTPGTPYAVIGDKVYLTREEYEKAENDKSAAIRKSAEERALKQLKVDDNGNSISAAEMKKQMYEQAKRDLKPLLKDELEKEAKMTAEELAQKRINEEREALKAERISVNRSACEFMLQQAGFDEDDIENILSSAVDDNVDASKGRVLAQIEMRKKYEEKLRAKVTSELSAQMPRTKTGKGGADTYQSQYDAAKAAKNTTAMVRVLREAADAGVDIKK